MDNPAESALVVPIPEAEALVESFRKQYDPSAAIGVPAHVTLLFPFISPNEITAQVISTLQELFSKFPYFSVSFPETRRFPGVLYLAPVPVEPFLQLSKMLTRHFPETPPYGGEFTHVTPHLTIAQVSDPRQLDEIAANFQLAARNRLPILSEVRTVVLFENSSGSWQVRMQFPLQSST
jgi:2'-5' RNA ligase